MVAVPTSRDNSFHGYRYRADIFDLTLGHKGLIGACGNYIQTTNSSSNDTPIRTLDDWKKHTPVKLLNRITHMDTYASIVRSFDDLKWERRRILIKVTRFGTCQIDLVS